MQNKTLKVIERRNSKSTWTVTEMQIRRQTKRELQTTSLTGSDGSHGKV